MRAGIWFEATFAYDTPLIVNVLASLEDTLSMVPEVTRQTFAGPFNKVGNVIGWGLLQIAPAVPPVFGAAYAEETLPKAIIRLNSPPTRYCNDILILRDVFIMFTFLFLESRRDLSP
jgi:hypothetical protein